MAEGKSTQWPAVRTDLYVTSAPPQSCSKPWNQTDTTNG